MHTVRRCDDEAYLYEIYGVRDRRVLRVLRNSGPASRTAGIVTSNGLKALANWAGHSANMSSYDSVIGFNTCRLIGCNENELPRKGPRCLCVYFFWLCPPPPGDNLLSLPISDEETKFKPPNISKINA